MLARGGDIVADDATKVTFEELGAYKDTSNTDGDDTYIVTLNRKWLRRIG
jgi:hypothetical protein